MIDKKKILNNKIQLVIAINLIHLDKNDIITFYVKSKNVICTPSDDTSNIMDELLQSLSKYYHEKLMIARADSSYIFHSVNELNIHFHTIDLKRTGTYIESPMWLVDKKATVNPKNTKDNYCFAYAAIKAIYHKELGDHLYRISSKLIEYTDKLNFNGINFSANKHDYKTFQKNNDTIALDIFHVPFNEEDILPEYVSKHNFNRDVQISLLKITDGDGKWHFLALKSCKVVDSDCMNSQKSFSRLMRGMSSSVYENYYCLDCFHSYRSQSALEKPTILCKEHTFCKTKFSEGANAILKHKHGSKSIRINDIIYVDLECLFTKYDTPNNSFNSSHTTNIAKPIPTGYSITVVRHHNKS